MRGLAHANSSFERDLAGGGRAGRAARQWLRLRRFREKPRRARPAAAGGPRSVGGIDALIALQGVEDPLERRKRAVKRGRVALDALDELKIGLLGGAPLSPATLAKLQAAAAHLKLGSGQAELDAVLAEIELRVEVEIAKMAPALAANERGRRACGRRPGS